MQSSTTSTNTWPSFNLINDAKLLIRNKLVFNTAEQ